MSTFRMPAIPAELHWKNKPLDWKLRPDNSLMIQAGENTDLFNNPASDSVQDDVPCALFTPPDLEFILSAKVTVDFASDFDAGVLQIRAGEDRWAKLCFEYSTRQEPMVVSVVTRGRSDDCNSVVIAGNTVYLRMAVTAQAIAFHYSLDGSFWHFVRFFTIGKLGRPLVGFSSQAPRGPKCSAVFSEISYRPGIIADNRSGE